LAKGNSVAAPETPPEAEASSACPNCGTEMVIIRIKPILFSWKFEELRLKLMSKEEVLYLKPSPGLE
jgi:hypothetical protein